jgi:hypothetical protein
MAPSRNPASSLSVFDWALHFDASLFAQLMRRVAEDNGVRRIDAKITKVNLRPRTASSPRWTCTPARRSRATCSSTARASAAC